MNNVSLQPTFGDLRTALHRPPSPAAFCGVMRAVSYLKAADPTVLVYALQHLDAWPSSARSISTHDLREWSRHPSDVLRCVHHLSVQSVSNRAAWFASPYLSTLRSLRSVQYTAESGAFQSLSNNTHLTKLAHLDLSFNQLDDVDYDALARSTWARQLTHLSLPLTAQVSPTLSPANYPHVTHLSLQGPNSEHALDPRFSDPSLIQGRSVGCMCDRCTYHGFPGNNLHHDSFIEFLQTSWDHLEHISLWSLYNQIDLFQSPLFSKLSSVRLFDCALSTALAPHPNLRSLTLQHTYTTGRVAQSEQLFRELLGGVLAPRLQHLSLLRPNSRRHDSPLPALSRLSSLSLNTLRVGYCQLETPFVHALLQHLPLHNLRHVALWQNRIADEDLHNLLGVLCTVLLTRLELYSQPLSSDLVRSVFKRLSSLTSLTLSQTRTHPRDFIAPLPNLQHLDLSLNELDDGAVQTLLSIQPDIFPNLRTLDLRNNAISVDLRAVLRTREHIRIRA